jgi:hypothetical protein
MFFVKRSQNALKQYPGDILLPATLFCEDPDLGQAKTRGVKQKKGHASPKLGSIDETIDNIADEDQSSIQRSQRKRKKASASGRKRQSKSPKSVADSSPTRRY